MYRKKAACRLLGLLGLGLVWLLIQRPPLEAGPTRLVPSLSLYSEYRDNILLTARDEKKDLITIAAGGIALEKKTLRLDARLKAELKKYLYKDFTHWNSTDKQLSLDADYRVTERLSAGISGRLRRDEPRGSDADDTGIAVTGDRDYKTLSLSGAYRTTETDRISLNASMAQTGVARVDENEDNTTRGAGIEFSSDISRYISNTILSTGVNYSRYSSETRNWNTGSFWVDETRRNYTSETWQGYVAVSGRLTETAGYYLQAGAGRMDTRETYTRTGLLGSFRNTAESGSWYGLFGAGLNWTGEYYTAALSGFRDVREGVGTNGAMERTSLSLDLTRNITEDFSLALGAACYLNQNQRETAADLDELTFSLAPAFNYKYSREMVLRGGFRYTRINDREGDSDRDSRMVFLEIRREFPIDID